MATKAQPVKIGPFTGGLNTYSDPSAVADEEAVDIINFDVDLDGSLISRPPMVRFGAGGRYINRPLGTFTTPAGKRMLIFSCTDSSGNPLTCFYNIDDNIFGNISSAYSATAMVVYQNKVYLIAPPGAVSGGSWDGTTFTAIAAMPKGATACVYKERIFVATGRLDTTNPSRVFFSGAANPTSWTGTDFFDVNNGDGQDIRKIYSYSGSIVIFKTYSTFAYAYESSPTKGQVQSVSASVGIDNGDCMVEADNVLYVASNSDVYSITNWSWEQLNIKVPFEASNAYGAWAANPYSLSRIGNRLVYRFYDTHYIFGIKTRTWTKWITTHVPDIWIQSPVIDTVTGIQTYFAGAYLNKDSNPLGNFLFKLKDGYTTTDLEVGGFNVSVTSKIYSMNVPYSFKRLMWWGVDILTKTAISVSAIPVSYGPAVRWKDLQAPQVPISKTWADMASNTWGSPLQVSLTVEDSTGINNTGGARMFLKFIKSLRFRQIQFNLTSNTDGSTVKGPLRVYSVTALVINKQLVSKKIS